MKARTGPVLPMIVRGCPEQSAYTMPHMAVAAIICTKQDVNGVVVHAQ